MTKITSPPCLPMTVSSPKLPRNAGGDRYYAGYSRSFVSDILSRWYGNALVLDPWNGSGTTTTVAAELGLNCIGFDLNPAMVVIARAALLSEEDISVIRHHASSLQRLRLVTAPIDKDDPLLEWLDESSVARVRALQTSLIGRARLSTSDISDLGSIEAFWLTLLFNTVRRSTKAWRSSNPTWVKSRRHAQPAKLYWRQAISETYRAAISLAPVGGTNSAKSRVLLGSSTDLFKHGFNPDLILGSPPYCTRLDYAVATRVELSVLGFSAAEQQELRRTLIGTTTVPPVMSNPAGEIGVTAQRTLEAIARHPSKASGSYYWKWLAQYFSGYASSLAQLALITTQTGTIGLVVQDSYYKELHLNLAQVTTEILATCGWRLYRAYAFAPRRSFAQINPRAVAYANNPLPNERALFFRMG